jgi:diguanylate cyclase (GGDEF)-like protein
MRNRLASLPPNQPDPDLMNRLFFVQQVCLILVVQITIVALAAHTSAGLSALLPNVLTAMPAFPAAAALLCASALLLSEPGRSRNLVFAGRVVAAFAACVASVSLGERILTAPLAFVALAQSHAAILPRELFSLAALFAFILLATVILLARTQQPLPSIATDAITCFLALLVLLLLLEFLFGAFTTGHAIVGFAAPQTIVCLVLLTVVTILRRAEYGALAFFLGYGIGSRIGRGLLPALLVLPFLRELGRARLLSTQLIPSPYATALLTSLATIVSLGLLLFVAAYINRMQTEIQGLTLRDELTGLYNVRGFNLLAEQALLLARRAKQEFGVLFIDLDNLKVINDNLGHAVGSATLVETARLLRTTFRETDVIARIGGDEFVVAGQFDLELISAAVDRLQACANTTGNESGRRFALSFSVGYAAVSNSRETVKDLLMRADQAMYDDKRQKKVLATA